ncbi:condensation domain-containing protein [Parafrankia sp. FMc6]|uniref:condensation domain-containing protein n=1 Tax=Parafrankia soli TaxID=2599596 RepID=UPI0034D5F5B8
MSGPPREASTAAGSLDELLRELRRRDVRLWAQDGRLRYSAPPGRVDQRLRDLLGARRDELIARLDSARSTATPPGGIASGGARSGGRADQPAPRVDEAVAPLSCGQERMWLLWKLAPDSAAYNVAFVVRLVGPLADADVVAAVHDLERRHDVLRTRFPACPDGSATPLAAEPGGLVVRVEHVDEAEAVRRTRQAAALPFDLEHRPPVEFTLFVLGPEVRWLSVRLHHIVADAESVTLLVDDLATALRGTDARAAGPVPRRYARWAARERALLAGPHRERMLSYWRDRLAGADPRVRLPGGLAPPGVPARTERGGRVAVDLPPALSAAVAEAVRRHRVTPFMVVAAAWRIALHRRTGQRDLVLATPVTLRGPDADDLVGYFGNTVLLRNALAAADSFGEILDRERAAVLGALEHRLPPFETIVDVLARPGRRGRAAVPNVMVAHAEIPPGPLWPPSVRGEVEEVVTGAAKVDLLLSTAETAGGDLEGVIEYDAGAVDQTTVERLAAAFTRALAGLARAPRQLLGDAGPAVRPVAVPDQVVPDQATTSGEPAPARVPAAVAATRRTLLSVWADVLGVGSIAVHDDFFEVGGTSLDAVRATARVSQAVGVDLPVRVLLENPTVAGLAAYVHAARARDRDRGGDRDWAGRPGHVWPPARSERAAVPATLLQRNLWVSHHRSADPSWLNVGATLDIRGPLDVEAAERALRHVAAAHRVLRSRFVVADSDLWMRTDPDPAVDVAVEDRRGAGVGVARQRALDEVRAALAAPFDLAAGPCARFRLVRLAADHHVVLSAVHHIAVDEASLDVLEREFAACYRAVVGGGRATLTPPAGGIDFGDYAAWERDGLASGSFDADVRWWRETMRPPLRRSVFRWTGPPGGPRAVVRAVPVDIEPRLAAAVTAVARSERTTPFVVLLSAFARLLARESGDRDVRVATNVSTRHRSGLEDVVGPLTDTVVLRMSVPGGEPERARDVVGAVRASFIAASGHRDLPFDALAFRLEADGLRRSDLAQAFFLFDEGAGGGDAPALGDGLVAARPPTAADTDYFEVAAHGYDAVLHLFRVGAGIRGQLAARSPAADLATTTRLLDDYLSLLEQLDESGAQP